MNMCPLVSDYSAEFDELCRLFIQNLVSLSLFFSVKFELEYVIVRNPTSPLKSLFHFGVCNQLHFNSVILIWRMSLERLSEWVSSKQIFSIVSQMCLILMLRSLKSNGFHQHFKVSDSNSSLTWELWASDCWGRRNIEHLCRVDLISFDEWLRRGSRDSSRESFCHTSLSCNICVQYDKEEEEKEAARRKHNCVLILLDIRTKHIQTGHTEIYLYGMHFKNNPNHKVETLRQVFIQHDGCYGY